MLLFWNSHKTGPAIIENIKLVLVLLF